MLHINHASVEVFKKQSTYLLQGTHTSDCSSVGSGEGEKEIERFVLLRDILQEANRLINEQI